MLLRRILRRGLKGDGDKERGWDGSDEKKVCSYLGKGIRDKGKICSYLGNGIEDEGKKCSYLGNGIEDEGKICSYLGNGIKDEGKITNIKLCSCVLTPHSKQSYITYWIIFFLCFSAFVLHIFVLFHAENFINIISG